jgi:hypothetical protein
MLDTYVSAAEAAADRGQQQALLAAISASDRALRRDECGVGASMARPVRSIPGLAARAGCYLLPVAQHAEQLLANGYSPVPLHPVSGRPAITRQLAGDTAFERAKASEKTAYAGK